MRTTIIFKDRYGDNEDFKGILRTETAYNAYEIVCKIRKYAHDYEESVADEDYDYATNPYTFMGYIKDYAETLEGVSNITFEAIEPIDFIVEW